MKRAVAAALCLSLGAGCATTATISRRNGGRDEAALVGGTSTSIMVDTGAGQRSISREDIVDIDHPGNVHAVVGALLLAYGILNISVGAPQCEARGGAFCAGVFTPAAVGLGMGIWGLSVWGKSTSAARKTTRAPELSLAPMFRAGHQTAGGGSLILRY